MTTPRHEYLPDAREAAAALPPHSIEAEQGVLGCALLAPEQAMSDCEEACVTVGWFYDQRHQAIWSALHSRYSDGLAIDVLTVKQWLDDHSELAGAGGLAYLASLPDVVPSAANLPAYLAVLSDKERLRRMQRDCRDILARIQQPDGTPVDELIAQHERNALALSEQAGGRAEVHIRVPILENIDRLEEYHRGSAQVTGLTTGLPYADKVLGGLGGENGNFIVIAARPGTGKTSIALDFTLHAALQHEWFSAVPLPELQKKIPAELYEAVMAGAAELPDPYVMGRDRSVAFERHRGLPCAFFSLEMSTLRLVRRAMFQHSGGDLQRFRTGYANKQDFDLLGRSAKLMAASNVWIDDTSRLTVDMFKARCRRMVRQYGIKMFCLDYIQLMKSHRERHQRPDRVAELEEISGEIRALSKELNVPIIILGQLNRDVEKGDRWRAPRSSDIKNCGAIEQDADVIMLLYKPKLAEQELADWEEHQRAYAAKLELEGDWSARLRRINLLVDKNRDGTTGDCELVFDGSSTHFHDYDLWRKQHGFKATAAGEKKIHRPEADDLEQGDAPHQP